MTTIIGPSFGAELRTAGLGDLPMAWSSDGTFTFSPTMTPAQIDAIKVVVAAHNPLKPRPPSPRDIAVAAIDTALVDVTVPSTVKAALAAIKAAL